jgi:hypothetical protein
VDGLGAVIGGFASPELRILIECSRRLQRGEVLSGAHLAAATDFEDRVRAAGIAPHRRRLT